MFSGQIWISVFKKLSKEQSMRAAVNFILNDLMRQIQLYVNAYFLFALTICCDIDAWLQRDL